MLSPALTSPLHSHTDHSTASWQPTKAIKINTFSIYSPSSFSQLMRQQLHSSRDSDLDSCSTPPRFPHPYIRNISKPCQLHPGHNHSSLLSPLWLIFSPWSHASWFLHSSQRNPVKDSTGIHACSNPDMVPILEYHWESSPTGSKVGHAVPLRIAPSALIPRSPPCPQTHEAHTQYAQKSSPPDSHMAPSLTALRSLLKCHFTWE